MKYLGGFLMFAGLFGFAISLVSLGLAILGFSTSSAMLGMAVLAGWLGAECVEHAEKRGRK